MLKDIENIKEQLEEVIKKNLPEEKENADKKYDIYSEQRRLAFNQAISQIPVSLIADEVLKVVVGNERKWIEDNWINFYESSKPLADFKKELLRKLNLLCHNKENKNNG